MNLLSLLNQLLSKADGSKTYSVSVILLVVGVIMSIQGNDTGAVLIGMSGLGATLRHAIDKQKPL